MRRNLSSMLPACFQLVTICFWLFSTPAAGNAITAWWATGYDTPQIAVYDNTTNKIYYSLCNSIGTPVFARNDSTALAFTYPPMQGTSIAAIGYGADGGNILDFFYFNELDSVVYMVEAIFTCNATTGLYTPQDGQTWRISNGTGTDVPDIDINSGLTVVNAGEDNGLRAFFKDTSGATAAMKYVPKGETNSGWQTGGYLSHINGTGLELGCAAIAAADKSYEYHVVNNVVAQENIEMSVSTSTTGNPKWNIRRFPNPIQAMNRSDYDPDWKNGSLTTSAMTTDDWFFDTQPGQNLNFSLVGYDYGNSGTSFENSSDTGTSNTKIGVALDAKGYPNVFYVGNDSALHQFYSYSGHWSNMTDQEEAKWPKADDANADFGVTYDPGDNKIWIYYMASGQMTQLYQSKNGTWEKAQTLLTFNSTMASNSSGSGSGSDSGLSTGAKAGLGVGLGLGVPLLAALIAWYVVSHRRSAAQNREAELAAVREAHARATSPGHQTPGSPAPQYTSVYGGDGSGYGYWMDGKWVPGTAIPMAMAMAQSQELPVGGGAADPNKQPQYMGAQGANGPGRFSELASPNHGGEQQQPVYEMYHESQPMEMSNDEAQVPVEMPSPGAVAGTGTGTGTGTETGTGTGTETGTGTGTGTGTETEAAAEATEVHHPSHGEA